MTGVRRGEDCFEGRCDACAEWYPLEADFWPVKGRGLRICRACDQTATRIRRAASSKATERDRQRAYRQVAREALNLSRRERRAARIALDPGFLAAERAYQRDYMRRRRAA